VGRFQVDQGPEPGTLSIEVCCSSGTYVRVLASDLGAALGGGAHLRRLRRTRVGSFVVAEARTLEQLKAAFAVGDASALRPPLDALGHLERVVVNDEVGADIGHGRALGRGSLGASGDGPFALVDAAGDLLAVYEVGDDDTARASVVLRPA
jgi:tRNA pseudouridine55 synthase